MMVKSGDAMRGVPALFLRDGGADPPWWAIAQVGRGLGRRGKRQRHLHHWYVVSNSFRIFGGWSDLNSHD